MPPTRDLAPVAPPRCGDGAAAHDVATVALDEAGRIVAANHAWYDAAERYDLDRASIDVGTDYLAVCEGAQGPDADLAREAAAGIREVLANRVGEFTMDYPCHSATTKRWFTLRAVPAGPGRCVVSHVDITTVREAEHAMRAEAHHLWSLADVDAEYVTLVDDDGSVVAGVPDHRLVLGERRWVGEDVFAVVHPRDRLAVEAAFARCRSLPGRREVVVARIGDTDGRWVHLELTATNRLHDPEVGGIVISGRDVTRRHQARVAELLWGVLLDEIPAAVVVTDDAGLVTVWNDGATELFGVGAETMIGRQVRTVGSSSAPWLADDVQRALAQDGRWSGTWAVRFAAHRRPVTVYAEMQRLRDEHSGFDGVLSVVVDQTERQHLLERLSHREEHDPTTGLRNRNGFVNALRSTLDELDADEQALLALISLDRFREVNATYGSEIGDDVLRAVARAIERNVPADAVTARLYGDVFAVVARVGTPSSELGERILRALRSVRVVEGAIELHASVGLRMLAGRDADPATAIDEAREAAADVKAAGGNGVCFFEDSLRDAMLERIGLQHDLVRAVADDELLVAFQPVVRIVDGAIVGAEALVRWEHPVHGVIPPDRFVPLAEDTGLIHDIGGWVLDEACRHAARWAARRPSRPIHVAVNLSPAQLRCDELPHRVQASVARWSVDPASITLELTESMVMSGGETAHRRLAALRATGVRLAIDDFGTGYSSLARLRNLPIDVLKIDRTFVAELHARCEDAAIVATVLQLADALGLDVVAEGVEGAGQRDALVRLGCPHGQGYFWRPPLDASSFDELVDARLP